MGRPSEVQLALAIPKGQSRTSFVFSVTLWGSGGLLMCVQASAGIKDTMRTASNRFLVLLLAATVATVLVAMVLTPSAARADCGDYVLIGTKVKPTENPHSGQSLPASSHQMPMAGHDGRKPCSGPMCSKAPVPLPTMPPSVVLVRANEAAVPALLQFLPETQHIDCCSNDPPARPLHLGTEVYHPPRS